MRTWAAFNTIERLVARIIAGEAVFFVGAGFSLDSEPNSSSRLIRRLIARFAAMTECLDKARLNKPDRGRAGSAANELRRGLQVTFGLGDTLLKSEQMVLEETIKKLNSVYYNINDWMCSAFTVLLRELKSAGPEIRNEIRILEAELLSRKGSGERPYDDVPLDDFDVDELTRNESISGKSLFLETMGFPNKQIWGGEPREPDYTSSIDSYGNRFRDRFHVIARLAREGVVPLILTTNFDLLLEGACRFAGFEIDDKNNTDPVKPWASYDRLLVIAGPAEFFERGNPYRAASLLKIHGCVHRYRIERKSQATLARYLPSMVFTYREIQNWRKDSWSRDLVSTLLRTRTIVLCGYSGADPVVHDTFRTVYEEIQATLPLKTTTPSAKSPGGKSGARAFFTGEAGKAEFAGLEILRAGSRAAGFDDTPLFQHPNYLPFHFYVGGKEREFPTLDELFVWIYHRTLRQMQLNAIRSDLRRIAVMLLHRNVAQADIDEISNVFDQQCKRENKLASRWDNTEHSRQQFRQITTWTNSFHVALLREFALMETVARNQRSRIRIQEFGSPGYYFALTDRPGWGAWGAVVEMALRRMAGLDAGLIADAGRFAYPVALVRSGSAESTRTAIILRGPGDVRNPTADIPGHYRRFHEWQLTDWMTGQTMPQSTPAAEDIWRWAFEPMDELRSERIDAWFGEPNERSVPDRAAAAGKAD